MPQIDLERARTMIRRVLIWALTIGKTSSTVYREVVYEENSSCTKEKLTTEFFAIPDNFGLQDFEVCLASTGNTSNYMKYECIKSTVVAGKYSDANCTDAVKGEARTEVTSELCTSDVTTHCSTTDPTTIASHNFSISFDIFPNSSCIDGDERVTSKDDTYAFRHPLTNSTRQCTSSDVLGFNSKLVCVDGELKTFYYEASDSRCESSPRAMSTSPSCMMVDTDAYYKIACEDLSPDVAVLPFPLDEDSTADTSFLHMMVYNDDGTGSCSELDGEVYYRQPPLGENGTFLSFEECCMYRPGLYAILGCDKDAGTVSIDYFSSSTCAAESLYSSYADMFNGGSCINSVKTTCTATLPINENMIDDWEVLLEYHEDDVCSSSTGEEERLSWAEFVDTMESSRTSLDDGSSYDDSTSIDFREARKFQSCTPSGMYNIKVNCVDGMTKSMMFSAEDTACSGTSFFMVHEISSCVEWEDEGEYAKVSCVEEVNDGSDDDNNNEDDDDAASALHLSKPLWLVGSTISAVVMVHSYTTTGGNF